MSHVHARARAREGAPDAVARPHGATFGVGGRGAGLSAGGIAGFGPVVVCAVACPAADTCARARPRCAVVFIARACDTQGGGYSLSSEHAAGARRLAGQPELPKNAVRVSLSMHVASVPSARQPGGTHGALDRPPHTPATTGGGPNSSDQRPSAKRHQAFVHYKIT